MTDQAKAAFKDGVLEIRMPAPPEQVTRGRRLEIKEGTDAIDLADSETEADPEVNLPHPATAVGLPKNGEVMCRCSRGSWARW